jgi:hypothetical protein
MTDNTLYTQQHEKAGVTMLISSKVDIKTINVMGHKEGHLISIKIPVHYT